MRATRKVYLKWGPADGIVQEVPSALTKVYVPWGSITTVLFDVPDPRWSPPWTVGVYAVSDKTIETFEWAGWLAPKPNEATS